MRANEARHARWLLKLSVRAMRTIGFLFLGTMTVRSLACTVPPPSLYRDPGALIEEARSIAVVTAFPDSSQPSACVLRVIKVLKGADSVNERFKCRLPHAGDWMTTFSWHGDGPFWSEGRGRLGVSSACSVVAPAFEIDHSYLLFAGMKPDLKEAEEVRAGDRWLEFVEARLPESKKPQPTPGAADES